jgi:hypothetical protein
MSPHRLRLSPLIVGLAAILAAGLPGRAAAEEGTGPRLRVDRLQHDFGAVGQEQELDTSFEYTNEGDAPLEGIRAIGDCGCYGVTVTKEALAPGESGTLHVKFRTLRFSGRVSKRLKIITANGEKEPQVVKLLLDVVAGVILAPGRIWFGDVLVGSAPTKTVYAKWHKETGQAFEITGVEVPGYDFTIETAPYAQGDWQGTAITFAFKKAPPLGMFSATALIRTTHPDYSRISIPVTAHVTGKVWLQSRTVYFGWVPKGKSKRSAILVKPFSPDVDLGEVTASSRQGRVTVHVEKHPMGREGWWRVVVEVPEDAEVGKLDDVLEIRTQVPGEETTELVVRGEVLDVGR